MRRTFFLLLTMVLGQMTFASEINHGLGVQVGWDREIYRLNSPSTLSNDKNQLSKTPLNGGRLGLFYELTHESGVGLFTSLNYAYTWHRSAWEKIPISPEGKVAKYEGNMLEYSSYTQLHRVDLCVQPEYKFEIAGETYLVLYTGPTFQYLTKYQAQDNFRFNDQELKKRYYFEEALRYNTEMMSSYYRLWNVTWGLGAAFQYDIFYIRGGYDFGLVNPYKIDDFGQVTIQNESGVPYSVFTEPDSNEPDHRQTRGRLDGWNITFGVFFWQSDK